MKFDQHTAQVGETNRAAADTPESEADRSGADQGSRTIAKDDAFHILQNARRRAVLRYLLDHHDREEFRMRDIAEAVAAWENDTSVQQLSSDQRQRVYIALYQSHLPKLDDHGVIRYNQARGVVAPAPLLSVFDRFVAQGLHEDTEQLTTDESAGYESDRSDTPGGKGLTDAISELLPR